MVTGILAEAARNGPVPATWRAAIDALWRHPITADHPLAHHRRLRCRARLRRRSDVLPWRSRSGEAERRGHPSCCRRFRASASVRLKPCVAGAPLTFGGMAIGRDGFHGDAVRRADAYGPILLDGIPPARFDDILRSSRRPQDGATRPGGARC